MAAEDLFLPAAERLSFALGGGLGVIALVERRRLRALGSSVLFIRWRTWLVTAPLYGAAVMWSAWGALAFVVALALVACHEYARLAGLGRPARAVLLAGAVAVPCAALAPRAWSAVPALAIVVASLAAFRARGGFREAALLAAGILYVPALLAHLLLLRGDPAAGPGLLLALGTAVALSDVCAFVVGRAWGRTPLARTLSPAKTWEGALGNVAGSYAGFALMAFALPPLPSVLAAMLPAVVAAACVAGDLAESMLKRGAGVKDAGTCVPGFGGLLDRIDSLLFALPAAWLAVEVFA